MFLRANRRFKDGKTHRYWSVVENRRVACGRSVQKTLLYLGEINDAERVAWTRAIEAVDEQDHTQQIHLFPEDRTPDPRLEHPSLKLRLDRIELDRAKLKATRRHEGQYLLRSNLSGEDPAELWRSYMNLVRIEESFRTLKGDLGLRPIFHQLDDRIEAHVFISFLAYCLHVSLEQIQQKGCDRPEFPQRAGAAQRDPDARCDHPGHRRARTADEALHQARESPPSVARPTRI